MATKKKRVAAARPPQLTDTDVDAARADMERRALAAGAPLPSPTTTRLETSLALGRAANLLRLLTEDPGLTFDEREELRRHALDVSRLARVVIDPRTRGVEHVAEPVDVVAHLVHYVREEISFTANPRGHGAWGPPMTDLNGGRFGVRDEAWWSQHFPEEHREMKKQRAMPVQPHGVDRDRLVRAIAMALGSATKPIKLPRRFGDRVWVSALTAHQERGRGGGCRCATCEARVIVRAALRAFGLDLRASHSRLR